MFTMQINTNTAAINTHRTLEQTNQDIDESLETLSSGQRINQAADDAAGLSISEKMDNQVSGLEQAERNAQDGTSMIQTAEGALEETHEVLQRGRELAVQAANDSYTEEDREDLQEEMDQLVDEIDRIAENTEFNTEELLDGGEDGDGVEFTFHIGANEGQNISVDIDNMDAESLGMREDAEGDPIDISSERSEADEAIDTIDEAIETVSEQRSELGAVQNRLDHTVSNLGVASENLEAAESRIRDADMADEMMEFQQEQVLEEAGTAMMAQANQQGQSVLQLLQ